MIAVDDHVAYFKKKFTPPEIMQLKVDLHTATF
jgi:hypothetical protein